MIKYDGKTSGLVFSINAIETTHQGFDGEKMVIPSYIVDFIYIIHGIEYVNSNIMPNHGKYEIFIDEINKSNYKKEIIVKYNLNNPQESLIIVE